MSQKPQLPPTPKDNKVKQALGLGIGIWDYFEEKQRELGDTFTLTLPGQGPMVWTCDQKMIKDILRLKEHQVDGSLVQLPVDFGEENLVFQSGKPHVDARKLVVPSFNAKRLRDRANVMHEIITEYIDRMEPGDEYNAPRLIGDITLDIISFTLFNLREGERRDRYRELMLAWLLEATSDKLFTIGSLIGARRFRIYLNGKYKARTAKGQMGNGKNGILPWKRVIDLKVQLAAMIREDIRWARERDDADDLSVCSILSRTRDADGNLLDEERVISELLGFMIAGHETSAATFSWLFIWLQRNPKILARIKHDVEECIQQEGKFDAVKISELPYLTACLNESQRLTPSAPGFIRWLTEDTQIGDWYLPKGSSVLANLYLTHRDPEIYGPDALEYNPERWLDGKRRFGPSEFLPFGGGNRACVGMNQGKQQLRIIMAEFARRVTFKSEFDNPNEPLPRSRVIGGQTEPELGVATKVLKVKPYSIDALVTKSA